MLEGEGRVTQVVRHLGYPGLPERGTFVGGGSLIPLLVVLLVVVSYSCQYLYSRWMSSKWMPLQSEAYTPNDF